MGEGDPTEGWQGIADPLTAPGSVVRLLFFLYPHFFFFFETSGFWNESDLALNSLLATY